jgi:hypothetical protein
LTAAGEHEAVDQVRAIEGQLEADRAALDRAEGAVEKDERRAFAVALVVKLERADVDVARGPRDHARVR